MRALFGKLAIVCALLSLSGCSQPRTVPISSTQTSAGGANAASTSDKPSKSDEIGLQVFDSWRSLAKRDGKDRVLADHTGAAAACIPWDQVQRLSSGLAIAIEHWWHDTGNRPEINRRNVMERCENWSASQDIDCRCHLISDHGRPVLTTPSSEAVRINTTIAVSVALDPATERAWLSEESAIPLIRDTGRLRLQHGMKSTRYYLDMGKTLSRTTDAIRQPSPELVMQRGHVESISVGRWSNNGKLVATAGQDNRVLLWNAADLKLLRDWRGHAAGVRALAFDPNDQTVASGGADGAVLIWDVPSGRRVATLFQSRGPVHNLYFGKNSSLLTLYEDNSVLQWTPPAGGASRQGEWTFKEVLAGGSAPVALRWQGQYHGAGESMELKDQPEGGRKFEIVPSSAPPIRVLDPDTGDVRELAPPWSGLTGVLSPRAGVLAARKSFIQFGSALIFPEGNKIRLSADNGASVTRVLQGPLDRAVEEMVFSPSGALFAASAAADQTKPEESQDAGRIRIWNLDVGGAPKTIDGRSVLAFSPDDRWLLGSAGENRVRIWDARSARIVRNSASGGHKLAASALSRDGKWLAIAWDDGAVHVWDLNAGRRAQILGGHPGTIGVMTFDTSGRYIAAGGNSQRFLSVWDLQTGSLVWAIAPTPSKDGMGGPGIESLLFSEDGNTVAYGVREENTDRVFLRGLHDGHLLSAHRGGLRVGPSGQQIIVEQFAHEPAGVRSKSGQTSAVRLRLRIQSQQSPPAELQMPKNGISSIEASAFSPDGRFFAVLRRGAEADFEKSMVTWVSEWETDSGLLRLDAPAAGFHTIAVATNGDVAAGQDDGRVVKWSKEGDESESPWAESELIRSSASIRSVSVNRNDALVAVGDDGLARIWRRGWTTGPVTIGSSEENAWIVTSEDGRFDFSESDRLEGFRWIMPDDPYRTLSPDIFMRDYFEPRLLARILTGEKLAQIPSLVNLNRAQPRVKIVAIERESTSGDSSARDTVRVVVEVSGTSEVVGLEKQQRRMESGVYDLRLFRDGQLVGQCPGEAVGQCSLRTITPDARELDSEGELAQWRRERLLVKLEEGKQKIVFTGIRLPRVNNLKQVQFSAYAFNDDRVKSDTDRKYYEIANEMQPSAPRAYILSIGVNRFEDDRWNLSYAVNDARAGGRELEAHLKALHQFQQVTFVPLVSEAVVGGRAKAATKAQIEAVLETLAGQRVKVGALAGIEGTKDLRRANPEDLVVVMISTHGVVDERGRFYLLPSDTGANFAPAQATDASERAAMLSHAVSNDELSQWLRGLDARNQVMIVDACHSAASVQSQEFKPAPMGSRGLGQLAFDQGMRILAATQVSQDEVETEEIGMGVLTYALVQEGLVHGDADYAPKDGQIMLSEWLRFASEEVPLISRRLDDGTLPGRRGTIYNPTDKDADKAMRSANQQPSLFDFAKGPNLQISRLSRQKRVSVSVPAGHR